MTLLEIEKATIQEALVACDGDKVSVASTLGISLGALNRKIRTHTLSALVKRRLKSSSLVPVGKLIRDARIRKNFALKTLAYDLGYSGPSFISKIERGERSMPKEIIPIIAKSLDLTREQLDQAIKESKRD